MLDRPSRSSLVLLVVLAVGFAGCADRAWQAAVRADEPAGYYRYMRDHPDSPRVAEAKERLDFHKLKRDLSLRAYDDFVEKYPSSTLTAGIQRELEPHAFASARAQGTVKAYEAFVESFPRGELVARARGNAAYIEANGFGGRAADLAAFAKQHPESDFAREAQRSAESTAVYARTRFDRVGLSIRISAATPEAERLARSFLERARATYANAGVALVVVPQVVDAATAAKLPAARLTIEHAETEVATSITGAALSRPGHVATTRVTLRASADAPPIFERVFTLRVDSTEHLAGASVLSSTAAPRYWKDFFVPVATAQTQVLRRPDIELAANAVAIDAIGDRSAVLFDDGRLQIVELADPEQPVVLGEYVRPNDLKKWSGVRILSDRVAIFGEEGIEIVGFGRDGAEVMGQLSRSQIGTVFAVERLGSRLAIAGARGLMLYDPQSGDVQLVMRRVLRGMAVLDETIVVTDGESVFISDLDLLREQRVHARLKLGRTFDPGRVRSFGRHVVVVGAGGAVVLDLTRPAKPGVTAKIHAREVGPIRDAAGVRDRVFLLGDRGLMLLDPSANRVAQWVDVDAKTRLAPMGRHVVALGDRRLQAVDATPLTAASLPASGTRHTR